MEKPEILFFISNVTLYFGEIYRVFPLVNAGKVTSCIQNNIITLLVTIAGKKI